MDAAMGNSRISGTQAYEEGTGRIFEFLLFLEEAINFPEEPGLATATGAQESGGAVTNRLALQEGPHFAQHQVQGVLAVYKISGFIRRGNTRSCLHHVPPLSNGADCKARTLTYRKPSGT
jgi:hypothetical protein